MRYREPKCTSQPAPDSTTSLTTTTTKRTDVKSLSPSEHKPPQRRRHEPQEAQENSEIGNNDGFVSTNNKKKEVVSAMRARCGNMRAGQAARKRDVRFELAAQRKVHRSGARRARIRSVDIDNRVALFALRPPDSRSFSAHCAANRPLPASQLYPIYQQLRRDVSVLIDMQKLVAQKQLRVLARTRLAVRANVWRVVAFVFSRSQISIGSVESASSW